MEQFLIQNFWLLVFLFGLWVLPWKGVAFWKSARASSKWWFIVLLVTNTFGLLKILYIFVFSKNVQSRI